MLKALIRYKDDQARARAEKAGLGGAFIEADSFKAFQETLLPSEFKLVDPDRATPVIFKKAHTRRGNEEHVRAHFAAAAGYGIEDHVFDRQSKNIRQAVRDGTKILLSLNDDLSYRALDFREMEGDTVHKLEQWMDVQNGNHISVSVRSAEECLKTLMKIKDMTDEKNVLSRQVFALYRGGVVPYRKFHISDVAREHTGLYDALAQGHEGVAIGETRMVGFPRLMRMSLTDSTYREGGRRGLKGNAIWREEARKNLFSRLIFADEGYEKTPAYRDLRVKMLGMRGVDHYVLASPSITLGKDDGKWQMLRWIITDPKSQICEAPMRTGESRNRTLNFQ